MNRNHKNKIDYGITDLYKFYVNESDTSSFTKKLVSYDVYKNFIKDLNTEIIKAIVLYNIDFTMPYRVGSLCIIKYKIKPKLDSSGNLIKTHLAVDWKKTKNLWKTKLYPNKSEEELKQIKNKKVIYHQNKHTDGYRMRFKYSIMTSNIKNKTVYKFIPSRKTKNFLSSTLKNPEIKTNYYEKSW